MKRNRLDTLLHVENLLGEASAYLDDLDPEQRDEVLFTTYEEVYGAMCRLANLRMDLVEEDANRLRTGVN